MPFRKMVTLVNLLFCEKCWFNLFWINLHSACSYYIPFRKKSNFRWNSYFTKDISFRKIYSVTPKWSKMNWNRDSNLPVLGEYFGPPVFTLYSHRFWNSSLPKKDIVFFVYSVSSFTRGLRGPSLHCLLKTPLCGILEEHILDPPRGLHLQLSWVLQCCA